MLISRNWLQSHITNELPSTKEIAETLLLHSFEIEGLSKNDHDEIIDIDVLPNRAHDCLCHKGVAKELSGLMNIELLENRYPHTLIDRKASKISVDIQETNKCRRYRAFEMDNIKVTESPLWLRQRLESLGQRSINNIVDATNYVMFDLGQPLHAFDADKVVGTIIVRNALAGESMKLLDGHDLELGTDDLVIADEEGILALAGIKGGMRAKLDENTKNIIVEIANFNPRTTRISSRRVKIQTDSSKRFENELSPKIVDEAYIAIESLLLELANSDDTELYNYVESYPESTVETSIELSMEKLTTVLGLDISHQEVSKLFDTFNFEHRYDKGIFYVRTPYERLDVKIAEDLIEEIGRWYGYHNIPNVSLDKIHFEPKIDQKTYLINKIKQFCVQSTYTELINYAFVEKGEIQLENPMASDKQFLRSELHTQLQTSLEHNKKSADYLGIDCVRIFEIGRAYHKQAEETFCVISCANVNKKAQKQYGTESEQLKKLISDLESKLGLSIDFQEYDNVLSFSVDDLVTDSKIDNYQDVFDLTSYGKDDTFHAISVYPYSKRDVSLWVKEGIGSQEVRDTIINASGEYLKKIYLFDEFSKDEKTSYAFSLIFQSNERTLVDEDVDGSMNELYQIFAEKGWEVR